MTRLTFGHIEGGPYHGLPSFFYHLEQTVPLPNDTDVIREAVLEYDTTARSFMVVHPAEAYTLETIQQIVVPLRENGYRIGCVWDGQFFPTWSQWIDYRVVELEQEDWVRCRVDEVRVYFPAVDPRRIPAQTAQVGAHILYTDELAATALDNTRTWRISEGQVASSEEVLWKESYKSSSG